MQRDDLDTVDPCEPRLQSRKRRGTVRKQHGHRLPGRLRQPDEPFDPCEVVGDGRHEIGPCELDRVLAVPSL